MGYSYQLKPTGVDYFQDGNPITNAAFSLATGVDTNALEQKASRDISGAMELNAMGYSTSDLFAPHDVPAKATDDGGAVLGSTAPVKVLDQAGLNSIDSLLASYDTIKSQGIRKAAIKRDTSLKEKEEEKTREEGKFNTSKLGVLQDFAGAKTDTDLNTRNTLENLVSSLSTLGLGGSRALTRQILDAANMSNRKANATQAKDTQGLDAAFNEYSAGNESDVKKISDQYGYDEGETNRQYLQNKQTALYKKADIYGNGGRDAEREAVMNEGNSLNDMIAGASFMNPSYTGETKAMATPELGDYTQDIAKYDTTQIGNVTPVGAGSAPGAVPGNLAIKAIAVNDKDLGIKKKTEGELGLVGV
jgi:hypothetical protein